MSKCNPETNNWSTGDEKFVHHPDEYIYQPDEKFIQIRPTHSFKMGTDYEYPTNVNNHRLNRLIWEYTAGTLDSKDELITELLNDRRDAIQTIYELDTYVDVLEERNDIVEEASRLRYR